MSIYSNKIAIITPYHMDPPSMRITQMEHFFLKYGTVDIVHPEKNKNVIKRLLELRIKVKHLPDYDRFIIYDLLTFIFLIDFVIKQRNKVIYDVLDYFPGYYSYKIGLRGFPQKLSIKFLSFIEKTIVRYVVPITIVNSPFLFRYLNYPNKTHPIFYSSPFEKYNIINDFNKDKIIGLYLGIYSVEKGADKIITIAQKYPNIEIHILGETTTSKKLCPDSYPQNIKHVGRLNEHKMVDYIKSLIKEGFIVGLSMISTDNPSYAVQEANKEIDYLCCGIPIIGNSRPATKEKIESGCGIYWNDNEQWEALLNSSQKRKSMNKKCTSYYSKLYTQQIANNMLRKIFRLS